MPDRDQLFFHLSGARGASGNSRPLEQVALIFGNYIHRWRPKRSRYLLRIFYKRISPRERFQYRLRPLYFIVPCSRHGVRLFWSIEIGIRLFSAAKACRRVQVPVSHHRFTEVLCCAHRKRAADVLLISDLLSHPRPRPRPSGRAAALQRQEAVRLGRG